ncbi:tRNA (guanosine(37)-N1)-methyltransferase TrmD [bacterium]|nr:tRNA (guanosine(37)-N1)-methyltransferase TrmD [bacterium]
MRIEIVTLFPEFFKGVFSQSILFRAVKAGKLEIVIHDLREYTTDQHHQADDYRFGGGAGMVLKPDPFFKLFENIVDGVKPRPLVIFPTPQGRIFDQECADFLSKEKHLIYICGHYKGIDQRIIDRWVDKKYSIGDYVISGGEAAVTVMLDAAVRMIPGVIGNLDSAMTDSFRSGLLDSFQFTRPEWIDGFKVPQILINGNHKNIDLWRLAVSRLVTKHYRPDLYKKYWNKNGKLEKNSSS